MYRAIVCDDEKYILDGLSQLIEQFDLDIQVVDKNSDGLSAKESFMKYKPDFLFIDINMPKLNGLDCLEAIYEFKKDCQIVIISSYDNFDYAKKAIKYGVLAYLLKPINDDELYEVLQKGIKKFNRLDNTEIVDKDYKKKIVDFISANYSDPNLSSDLLESEFNISRTTIFNTMKQITDKSLNEYITMIRIKKATKLLNDDANYQLKDIALAIGYHDPFYFSRVFKRQTGYSPSVYRKMLRGES